MKTKKLLATILMSTTALLACGNSVSAMWGYGYGVPPQGPVTYEQIGQAANWRPLVHGEDRQTLNLIIHAYQGPIDKFGNSNPYADDSLGRAKAQEALDNIAFKHNF